MRLLRDFRCDSCNSDQERYIDSDIEEVSCMWCNGIAHRIVGTPKIALDGTDPDFPGAYNKWASTREQNRVVKGRRSYQRP